jgi:hypothetical protein
MKRGVNELSPVSAAYIAGIIDGEGTVTLPRLHANENRRLVVSIANMEIALLRFVHGEIGAGKVTRKRTTSNRHTPSFCYSVTSRQALELLRQVSPFLQSYKRQRAELAPAGYEAMTPRNGKYTAAQLAARKRFEEIFLATTPRGGIGMPASSPDETINRSTTTP